MSHWQSLSVFLAVAEEGSFSGAAKKLDLAQPTVSFHIDNLEKNVGCLLVERSAKGATLTVYGEVLYAHTKKANTLLQTAENRLRAMTAGDTGRITVGASTIPAEYILPGLLAAFLREHPGLEARLITGDSQSVQAAFVAGEIPIAVVGAPPGDDGVAQPLWRDELILVAHPAVAAGLGASPTPAAVLALPLVARARSSGSMRAVLAELARHGFSPDKLRIVLEVGGNEALKAAVINQAGAGFISRWAVRDELASGCLTAIELADIKITRQFYAVCRPPLIPACVQAFWEYLLASSEK